MREAIEGQKDLLSGYEALTPEQLAAMQSDLDQLDAWDKEVEELLTKRKNGYLTDDEQTRLQEILNAKAELEIKYSLDAGSGYEQIITGMHAALERAGNGGHMNDTFLGDTMNALAEGRRAYMDALNQSYDAEYAQIQLIEDETARMTALEQLNEQYRTKRAEGEEEYAAAVREAGKTVWENSDMSYQIAAIDELAALIGSFEEIDVVDCRYFTLDMREFVEQHAITDILFANNINHAFTERTAVSYERYIGQHYAEPQVRKTTAFHRRYTKRRPARRRR